MASTAKKSDRVAKHIGSAVSVSELGTGILRYFENDGETKICGVELDEPKGDCNGQDLDGNEHFSCAENHGIYIQMKEVTLLNASGQPIVTKKATKKAAPKKKFESPPSLRKKINRKPSSRPSSTDTASSGKPSKSKNPSSKLTAGATAAKKKKESQGARKKVDHLSKQASGINSSVSAYADGDRKVIKRNPAPGVGAGAAPAATGDDDELPPLEENGDDAAPNFKREAPTDWIEAAKEKQREAELEIEREKEAADLLAQEARMAESEAKREAEEAEFIRKAEERKRKSDEEKQKRMEERAAQAKERAERREQKEKDALAEISAHAKVNENELKRAEQRDAKVLEQRTAQKARIAALMSKVKSSSASSTPRGSPMVPTPPTPASPEPTALSSLVGARDPMMSPDVDL